MNALRRALAACALLLAAALGFDAGAQALARPDFAATIAGANVSAWNAITTGHGSGVSVAVMARGEFVLSEAMGVAERAENRRVDRNTRFNIGSVSKVFAGVAILLLVEDGKVALDAPVARYVPEFTMDDARYRDITVRMLLNHSAGLPGSTFFFGYEPLASMQALLLETLKRSRLKHAPGAMSMYCNDCFTLAEIVVERASGRGYLDFLAARVFAPLGMTNTGPSVGEWGGANIAEYYDAVTAKRYPREAVTLYATGGLSSTAEDLCRFGDSLMPGGRALLSEASLRELLKAQPSAFADKLRGAQRYAQLAWDYSTHAGDPASGLQVFGKGGNTAVYSANLQIIPSERVVIALITSGKSGADKLTEAIVAGLLQDRGLAAPARPLARPPDAQPIPAELARYAGTYAMESGALNVAFDRARRKVVLAPLGSATPPQDLTYSDGFFRGPAGDMRYYFATVGGVDYLVARIAGLAGYDMVAFQKLPAVRDTRGLREPMRDGLWLIRNAPPAMEVFEDLNLMQPSSTFDRLPGYVDMGGIRRVERADFAAMAATAMRDQTDLEVIERDGETWVRTGNVLRSNARTAPALQAGASSVTIGAQGYNEWRAVGAGAVLAFARPVKGRVIVVTRDATLHDSIVDGGDVYAPAGSYVFFAGAPGDTFGVTAQ